MILMKPNLVCKPVCYNITFCACFTGAASDSQVSSSSDSSPRISPLLPPLAQLMSWQSPVRFSEVCAAKPAGFASPPSKLSWQTRPHPDSTTKRVRHQRRQFVFKGVVLDILKMVFKANPFPDQDLYSHLSQTLQVPVHKIEVSLTLVSGAYT